MQKASEYLQYAAECKALAGSATSPEQREVLLRMANTWDALVRDREVRVARQKHFADIENGPLDM
jgi:hypothetical protein